MPSGKQTRDERALDLLGILMYKQMPKILCPSPGTYQDRAIGRGRAKHVLMMFILFEGIPISIRALAERTGVHHASMQKASSVLLYHEYVFKDYTVRRGNHAVSVVRINRKKLEALPYIKDPLVKESGSGNHVNHHRGQQWRDNHPLQINGECYGSTRSRLEEPSGQEETA